MGHEDENIDSRYNANRYNANDVVAAKYTAPKKSWYCIHKYQLDDANRALNILSSAGIPPEHIRVSCFGDSFANTMIWYYSDKKIL